jgi:putative acetyltransferase
VIVRQEASNDIVVVRSVVAAAFNRDDGSDPVETRLLDALRDCPAWIPAMSIVATIENKVVGHAVCTRGHVDEISCVGLGPISVMPKMQRRGVGSALMHTMLGIAEGVNEPLVALLGSPDYYSRFGFVSSDTIGIQPPDESWGGFFQVRTLSAYNRSTTGSFTYAEPFAHL